ncbi:MAG: hypothetical protein RL189_1616 [Pseudomonadota bacterium]|jgi:hypothetical protein
MSPKEILNLLKSHIGKVNLRLFAVVSFVLVVITGWSLLSKERPHDDDRLFEEWVRAQLRNIEAWQMTTPSDDVRSGEAVKCVWQQLSSEVDCIVPSDFSYPLTFRLSNGYVLSSGLRFPFQTKTGWAVISRQLKHYSRGFGFDENWRPCLGERCRFEVFTGFVPQCAGNASVCGRAEVLKIFYVIKSRRKNRQFWQPYETIISNMERKRQQSLIDFRTVNALALPRRSCKEPAQVPLSFKGDGGIVCGLSQRSIEDICFGQDKPYDVLFRGGFCFGENCKRFCSRAKKIFQRPCETGNLEVVSRSPDLFRCRGRGRVLYLAKSVNIFDQPTSLKRSNLLLRVFNFDADFCLTRMTCFGSFAGQRNDSEFDVYLETK